MLVLGREEAVKIYLRGQPTKFFILFLLIFREEENSEFLKLIDKFRGKKIHKSLWLF